MTKIPQFVPCKSPLPSRWQLRWAAMKRSKQRRSMSGQRAGVAYNAGKAVVERRKIEARADYRQQPGVLIGVTHFAGDSRAVTR